jgi:hypothetical protein
MDVVAVFVESIVVVVVLAVIDDKDTAAADGTNV